MARQSYCWLLIAAVFLLTVQILAVVIYLYSFVPPVWDDSFLKGLEPNRDALFYMIFLGTNVVLMAMGVKWILPKLEGQDFLARFKLWLGLESAWCFLIVFCFFKWTTYRYPFWNILPYENTTWLQPFFCVICLLAVLSKIFFPEIVNLFRRWESLAGKEAYPRWYKIAFQVFFITGVIVLLYIPRPQDVTALALVWDQWDHLDHVAGWFIRHGWYVNYEEVIQMLAMTAVAYLIGLFYFIRLWLNSWLLAAIGMVLAIKFGMFYYGSAPCVWINPANTFLAHGWDIALFFGFWFLSSKYPKKFYASAALVGIALVWAWFKSNGYIEGLGFDNQPMMAPLRVRQFFPFFMGYFVPLFYVFSLLVLMGQRSAQSFPEKRLPLVLCVYGLMIFTNYLEHPMIGYYGALIVPAILITLWWLNQCFFCSTLFFKRGAYAGILLLAIGALLTNRLMLIYPDYIYQNNDRFASERASYGQFDSIAPSASLIQELIKEDQKAVVLSNFETALLMQAHRQPLFNNFPVMYSSLSNSPGGLNLMTKEQVLSLINSLEDENALYVFVDGRLWLLPPQALGDSGLKTILDYLRRHYQEYTRRGFLVALQRR